MKKAVVFTLTFLLGIFTVTAQNTGVVQGRYDLTNMIQEGEDGEIDHFEWIKELFILAGIDMPDQYIEFLSNGIFRQVHDDVIIQGTFTQNGSNLLFTINEMPLIGTIEGNKIILFMQENVRFIYAR